MVIAKAQRETRFRARAARIDSTVVEADIRYPSDAMLALQGARALAREGKKLQQIDQRQGAAGQRPFALGRQAVRAISQDARPAHGRGQGEVMALNEQAGRLIARSVSEAQRLAAAARALGAWAWRRGQARGPRPGSRSSPAAARR